MARTVPAGNPLWARTAEIGDYGGNTEKRDYLDRKGVDAITDVSASQFARLTTDAAAYARTAPIAVLTLCCVDSGAYHTPDGNATTITGPRAPMIEYVHMVTGTRLVAYAGDAPPAGFPSAVRNGDGDVTINFAPSYTDAYGVEYALTIAHVKPGTPIATAVQRAVAERVSATSIRIRVFTAADAAAANARVSGVQVF